MNEDFSPKGQIQAHYNPSGVTAGIALAQGF